MCRFVIVIMNYSPRVPCRLQVSACGLGCARCAGVRCAMRPGVRCPRCKESPSVPCARRSLSLSNTEWGSPVLLGAGLAGDPGRNQEDAKRGTNVATGRRPNDTATESHHYRPMGPPACAESPVCDHAYATSPTRVLSFRSRSMEALGVNSDTPAGAATASIEVR